MEVQRKHMSIDATGKAVGRIATEVATYLRGKHRPIFDPSKDLGDFVTVKNITKVVFTGKKLVQNYQNISHNEFLFPIGYQSTKV